MRDIRAISILVLMMLTSCASSRTVLVQDEEKRPIESAGLFPAAIVPFGPGNQSDADGRLRIYQIRTFDEYQIIKKGYETVVIPYPDEDNSVVTLKKIPNKAVDSMATRVTPPAEQEPRHGQP